MQRNRLYFLAAMPRKGKDMHKVYLVGPIGGKTYGEAIGWRTIVSKALRYKGFEPICPMTGKQVLNDGNKIGTGLNNATAVKNGTILHTDLYRVRESDIILVNFLDIKVGETTTPPIGSLIEIGYASALRKLIVVVATDPYVQQHPFIAGLSVVVSTMEEAIQVIENAPGGRGDE